MARRKMKKIKRFTSRMQAKLLLVFCAIILALAALIVRLIYLVNTDGERYAKEVLSRQSYVSAVLPYKRGSILDANGSVLAKSELQYRLILDPYYLSKNTEEISETLRVLEEHFGVSNQEVQEILNNRADSQYVILLKT